MGTLLRWKTFILIFITINLSSGKPQNAANISTDTVDDNIYEDNTENISTETDYYNYYDELPTNSSTEIETICYFNEFKCHSSDGNCIRGSWRCDGEDDCRDGSDEKNCFNNPSTLRTGPDCGFGSFACYDDSDRCIRADWRCDGEDDCKDGSDEKNCYSNRLSYAQCPSSEFMCRDGSERCIRGSWKCDGEYDCKDGSDEKNCFTSKFECPSNEFMCLDGSSRCIRGSWRCDGSEDCMDGSDEKNCYNTELIQQQQNISNALGIFRDIGSENQNLEGLRSIIEALTNPTEADKARFFFLCDIATKLKLLECSAKCTTARCYATELQNYQNACNTGNQLTCTVQCGIANSVRTRRIRERPNKRKPKRRPSNPNKNRPLKPTRIIGGLEVNPPRKYPWQIILGLNDQFRCGGSIINSRWILTAAHCIHDLINCNNYPLDALTVTVGEHNRGGTNDDDPVNTITYKVIRREIHDEYTCSTDASIPFPTRLDHDFALLELTSEIPFNDVIRPVCLPKDDSKNYAGEEATVSGWGYTAADGSTIEPITIEPTDILMEVEVSIDDQADCRFFDFNGPLPESQLCAGPIETPTGGKGPCLQDNGGPLVVKEGSKHILVGVVSYGSFFCGNQQVGSAVYARVSKALKWIMETTA